MEVRSEPEHTKETGHEARQSLTVQRQSHKEEMSMDISAKDWALALTMIEKLRLTCDAHGEMFGQLLYPLHAMPGGQYPRPAPHRRYVYESIRDSSRDRCTALRRPGRYEVADAL